MRLNRWLPAALLLLCASPAFASVGVKNKGSTLGNATYIDSGNGTVITLSGDTATVTGNGGELSIPLYLESGVVHIVSASGPTLPSFNTTPALLYDATNFFEYIRWTSGETSKIEKKFRVPANYSSGGALRVVVGRSGATNLPPQLAWRVFKNDSLVAYDLVTTTQTSVTVSSSVAGGSQEEKNLVTLTDFGSLAAGDLITVDFWRDNANSSTEDLQLLYAEFYYTASASS